MTMLHDFLTKERDHILGKCNDENIRMAGTKLISPAMREGWSIFFDQLIYILSHDEELITELLGNEKLPFEITRFKLSIRKDGHDPSPTEKTVLSNGKARILKDNWLGFSPAAAERGREYLRLGYTLSDVVHGYGIVCQTITSCAHELNYKIEPAEFGRLNLSLDIAIAAAVMEYENVKSDLAQKNDLTRIGFLAHELRNSLTSAFIVLELIESGEIGALSVTGRLLNRSLVSMKSLIDSALLTVRLDVEPTPHPEWIRLLEAVSDVEVTAASEARKKKIAFKVDVSPDLSVFVDRQILTSALGNLTQNAVKFTRASGLVTIRASLNANLVTIEIEDECGGIPAAKLKNLFKPFEQMNEDKSGVGLGLTISHQAIQLSGGELSARDIPGKGCIFSVVLPGRIDKPTAVTKQSPARSSVSSNSGGNGLLVK